MPEKKHKKIPSISPDRVDQSPPNTSVGLTKEDQMAHAFVKGKEPIQRLTIRIPVGMYDDLCDVAFKNGRLKLNHIVLKLLRDYIKENKNGS
jgi:hypothetical protein